METIGITAATCSERRPWGSPKARSLTRFRIGICAVVALALLESGCASIGSATVKADRINYATALANSWKDQTLLNIVKLRYLDVPEFLDVSSVVSSRELQGEARMSPRIFPDSPVDTYAQPFLAGRYTDRPTISYTPLTGERFINSQLRPIPTETVFAMIEAGHDAGFILRVSVRAINGIYNSHVSLGDDQLDETKFVTLSRAMRRLQAVRAMGVRSEPGKGHDEKTWIFFRKGLGGSIDKDEAAVKALLRLDPRKDEFLLVAGERAKPDQVQMLTRSVHEILAELAAGVDVPEEDIASGRAARFGRAAERFGTEGEPLVHISSGRAAPADAYAAAQYRDRWFWIDDTDLRSKRIFLFLLAFTALAERQAQPQVPVLTTPTR